MAKYSACVINFIHVYDPKMAPTPLIREFDLWSELDVWRIVYVLKEFFDVSIKKRKNEVKRRDEKNI